MKIQILELIEGAKQAEGLTVIIDVFRAFTTECYCFAGGASACYPIGALEDAFALKRLHPDWVLLGERGGTVVEILGMRDTSPVTERQEGFLRALKAHPEITIEGALYANWMQDQAQDRFKEYLVVYGKSADVVFAQNDAMAYGAWLAARDLRVEGISFIGADGLDVEGGGVDLVNRGILDSTIYYPTGARPAVEYSMRILSGEKLEEKQIILTPERIP